MPPASGLCNEAFSMDLAELEEELKNMKVLPYQHVYIGYCPFLV